MTAMVLLWRSRYEAGPHGFLVARQTIPLLGVLLGNEWESFDVGVALFLWNGVVGVA